MRIDTLRYLSCQSIVLLLLGAVACVPVSLYEEISPNPGTNLRTHPGGIVLRIDRSKDLPNAFGGRDIFGGRVGLGYSELRFLGLSPEGQLRFRTTEVRVGSSESTMTRYGVGGTLPTLDQTRNVYPPETTEFTLDLNHSQDLDYQGFRVHIEAAVSHELTYNLWKISAQ